MAGHYVDYTITLTGSAQQLSTACMGSGADRSFRVLELQPDGANANEIFVGGTSAVSSSAYGTRLEAADTGIPPAPWRAPEAFDSLAQLSDYWVKGTNTEKLHVAIWVSA